jgi:glycosyltransferase involved in cell wall biosynthesis
MGTGSFSQSYTGEIAILIPAYNEEERIEKTINAAKNLGEVYVADDASTDKTKELAEFAEATVISAPYNMGKGGVLNFALPKTQGDIILLLDADLEESCQEGAKIIRAVFEGADLAVGLFRSHGGFGLVRRIASFLLYLQTGHYYRAPLSGQRAARKEVWQQLTPFASGFSIEVAMLKKANHLGLKVVEVPVDMQDRSYGRGVRGMKHRCSQLLAVIRGLRG